MRPTRSSERTTVVRWLAIVPTAMLVWWGMLLFGVFLDTLAVRYCPSDALISGFCTATWFQPLERGIIVGCAGLTGFLIVFCASAVAPAQRRLVAWAMFLAGLLVVGMMGYQTGAYYECTAAIGAGLCGVFAVVKLLPPTA